MKNIFNRMNEDQIEMNDAHTIEIDTDRVKALTMGRIQPKQSVSFSKKVIRVAASFLLFFTVTGATTYAFGGPVLRSYIQEALGLEVGEVLLVGESISNKHYRMTIEDFVYDGLRGEVTLSVSALSDVAKETFETDRLFDKLGHFSIGHGIGELDEYREENKRFFSISFSQSFGENEYLAQLDNLIFAFEGMKDMIRIPLDPTLESYQKAIDIPAQGDYPVENHTMIYSKLGFTLIGERVNEDADFGNITVDFILKNGETIEFINRINYRYKSRETKPTVESKNQKSRKETIIMDGKEVEVDVAESSTVKDDSIVEGVDFVDDINDEWFAGSSGSGYSEGDKYMVEQSFTFSQSFDWENVDKMIINTVEIVFD